MNNLLKIFIIPKNISYVPMRNFGYKITHKENKNNYHMICAIQNCIELLI